MVRLLRRGVNKAVILVSIAILAPMAARADGLKDTTPNISVIGTAFEDAAPDETLVSLAVVTERPAARDAQDENAQAARAVTAELTANGVAAQDIQTKVASLAPVLRDERDPKGVVKRTVKLFRARNEIVAKIRGADTAGKLLAALVDKGANEILDVSFNVSDAAHRMEELRKKAMLDARARAQAYVEAIDLKLARVLEIRPGEEDAPQPALAPHVLRAAPVAAAPGAGVAEIPLNPGLQRLTASVVVTFALSR